MEDLNFFSLLKDNSKIIEINPSAKELSNGEIQYVNEFVLLNDTKLSDAFHFLPYGVIDKNVTGIGATTLELNSKRNSIIVEPLRAIAASKAALDTENYLYIGSAFGQFKNRVKVEDQIKYLHNKNIEFKKILIVADSLPNFMDLLLDTLGEEVYSTFNIMIDEVDSFQTDSTFRKSIELALDIYKRFNVKNRCLVSATLLEFSDPELINESKTTFRYQNAVKRNLNLVHTETLELTTSDKIKQLLNNKPNQKIVVACISLEIINTIINDLKETFKVESKIIKILCSHSSSSIAAEHFGEIYENKLPGIINFMTSAYFTGVDIKENYHNISICSYTQRFTLLSNHKLKQIAGRCRGDLFSETIIYKCPSLQKKEVQLSIKDLVNIAEKKMQAIGCFRMAYSQNEYLRETLIKSNQNLIKMADYFGYNFIRTNVNNDDAYSWCNIDAYLENQRIWNLLYSDKSQLKSILSKEEQVNYFEYNSQRTLSDKSLIFDKERKNQIKRDAIETLRGVRDFTEFYELKSQINTPSPAERVQNIYENMLDFFDAEESIIYTEYFSFQKDPSGFNFFIEAANFCSLNNKDPFKVEMIETFKIGNVLTNEEIQVNLNRIYSQFFKPLELVNSPVKAKKQLGCYFKVRPLRAGGCKIIGMNPKKLNITANEDTYVNGKRIVNFDNIPPLD